MENGTKEALERGLNSTEERKEELRQEMKVLEMSQETKVEDKGKIEEKSNPIVSDGKIEVPMIENPTKPNRERKIRLAPKQKEMIKNLIKALGVVTTAANKTGINPWTHYDWMKNNPIYRAKVEEISLGVEDTIENAFLGLVIEKNPQVVIHAAKTKLRNRGYGEKIEIKSDVNIHGGLTLENDPREIMRRVEERRRLRETKSTG